jgi:hypothetical protein
MDRAANQAQVFKLPKRLNYRTFLVAIQILELCVGCFRNTVRVSLMRDAQEHNSVARGNGSGAD